MKHNKFLVKIISIFAILSMVTIGFSACIQARPVEATGINPLAFVNPVVELIYLWGFFDGHNTAINSDYTAILNNYLWNMRNDTANCLSYGNAEVVNSANYYNMSRWVYERYASSSAYALYDLQKIAGLPYYYDASKIMVNSPVVTDLLATMKHDIQIYNNVFAEYPNIQSSFTDTLSSGSWSVATVGSGDSSHDYKSKLYFTNHVGNGWVYIENGSVIKIYEHTGYSQSGLCDIKTANGTTVFSKTYMVNQTGTYSFIAPTGLYKVSTSACNVFINNCSANYNSTSTVHPCLTVTYGDNSAYKYQGYWLGYDLTSGYYDGGDIKAPIYWGSLGLLQNMAFTHVSFVNGAYETCYIDMAPILKDLASITKYVPDILSDCNSVAYASYMAQVNSNGTAPRISPDIMAFDPSQLTGLNYQQLYVLYITYLNALKDAEDNYTKLKPEDVNISGESFNLLCRGTIYNETGVSLGDNTTVFTPFISISDYELKLGDNNMSQIGFYLTYGNSTDLKTFNQSMVKLSYNTFKAGYNFHVDEMMYKNETVITQWLNITKIKYIYGDSNNTINPEPGFAGSNNKYLIYEIAGAICVFVGVALWFTGATVNHEVIKVIGKLIFVVGCILFIYVGGMMLYDALIGTWNGLIKWLQNQLR